MDRGASSARACCSRGSRLPPGVDDIDVAEATRHAAMTHCVRLTRLSLTVVECGTELIRFLAADHIHRVPEIRGTHLVRNVLELADDLSTLDLVEDLTTELRIVSLLVDRERSVADNSNSAIGCCNDVVPADILLAGEQRHVRHSLELNARPVVGVRASMRADRTLVGIIPPLEPVGLLACGLVIVDNSILDDHEVFGLY